MSAQIWCDMCQQYHAGSGCHNAGIESHAPLTQPEDPRAVEIIKQLTESNRQLRECVEAVEMENKRLSKENDSLREELERVKTFAKDAALALAAAKEALAMCLELEGTSSMSYDPDEYNAAIYNALARIAECEKGTATT